MTVRLPHQKRPDTLCYDFTSFIVLFKFPVAVHLLRIGIVGNRIVNFLAVSVRIHIFHAEGIIVRRRHHLLRLYRRPGIERVERKNPARHKLLTKVLKRVLLQLLRRKMHKPASCNNRKRVLAAGAELRHIRRVNVKRESHFPSLGGSNLTHFLRKVRAVCHNPAFRKIQQYRTGSAGNIYDTVVTVLLGKFIIKLLKALVIILTVPVHYLEIAVIILRHIFKIV